MNIRQCDCWGNVIGDACLLVEVVADIRVTHIIVNKNIARLRLVSLLFCNEGATYMWWQFGKYKHSIGLYAYKD